MISTSVTKIKNNLKLVYEFIAKNLHRRERVSKIKYSTIFRDWLLFIPLVASLKGKRLVFRFSYWCNQKRKTNRFSFARCAFLIDKTVKRADF